MTMTKLTLIATIVVILTACNCTEDNNVSENKNVIQKEIQDSSEIRRLDLIEKINNNTISLIEQEELDSLENEKYKKELKNAVLNMTETK